MKMRIPPGMAALVRDKIPSQKTAFEYIICGRRFTGPEAFAEGLVHRATKEENVINDSIDMVTEIVGDEAFDKATMRTLKIDLHKEIFKELTRDYSLDDLQLLPTHKSRL